MMLQFTPFNTHWTIKLQEDRERLGKNFDHHLAPVFNMVLAHSWSPVKE